MKLSPAMKRALAVLSRGVLVITFDDYGRPDTTSIREATLRSLEYRGWVSRTRTSESPTTWARVETWSITPAGRALLEKEGT